MKSPIITFTQIEAEVLKHRLEYLAELDTSDMRELFPDHPDPARLAERAGALGRRMKYSGPSVIQLDMLPDAELLLIEAIEGSTHHELAEESESAGMITWQKRNAYHRAQETAAEKLQAATGREVKLPG